MARIIGALACSHGPLLSVEPAKWVLRAGADRKSDKHWLRGERHDYAGLLTVRGPAAEAQIQPAAQEAAFAACQQELDRLADRCAALAPDLVVIVGNDQREVFKEDLTPAITVFTGEHIDNIPLGPEQLAQLPPGVAEAEPGHCPHEGARYDGAAGAATSLVRSFMEQGFDVATSTRMPGGADRQHGIPHAFGFIYRRLLRDAPPPSIPLILNLGVEPNQLRLGRTMALGRALSQALNSLPADTRVLLIGSGGLSHFVVDEALDQRVLKALATGDEQDLLNIPESYFNGNTCEIKSWFVIDAAMRAAGGAMTRHAYVPCYRTEAGTGSGMGFAEWGITR